MTRPLPERVKPYGNPEQRWLIAVTEAATGGNVVIDHLAEDPCTVNADHLLICLRAGLTTDEMLHVLPRAALSAVFGSTADGADTRPFPLYAVPDILNPRH